MRKWEYRNMLRRRPITDGGWLNELGNDGWELVAIDDTVYIFKRPVIERQVSGVELDYKSRSIFPNEQE